MVSNPEILEALRKKEKEYTYTSNNASLKRNVFYFWDDNDKDAAEYCEKLKSQEFGQANPIKLTPVYTADDWISTYNKEISDSVIQYAIKHKVYCLFVSTDAARFNGSIFREKGISSVEWHYQFLFLGTELPADVPDNSFDVGWIVNPRDIQVAQVLLADACFSDEWILPGNWGFEIGGGWYRLRAARYSSVGDDLCGQLYHKLTPVFRNEDEKDLERELAGLYRSMYYRVREVYMKSPHLRYLPLPGYQELQLKLWPNRKNRKNVALQLRTYDVLQILFGTEHEEPRPEWLRKQIVMHYIPKACEANIRIYEMELHDQLFRRFSLDDLYNKVAGIALNSANQKFVLCSQIDEEILSQLDKTYQAVGNDFQSVYNGFGQYSKEWDQYISEYLTGVWLRELSKYIISLSNRCRDDFGKLKRAYNEFEDYKDNLSKNAFIPMQNIRNYSDLLRAISESSALTEYTYEMLSPIRKRAAELYLQTGDDVAADRRPKIGVLVSDELVGTSETTYDCFDWSYHPRNYMPKNIIYELKMYRAGTAG